MSRIAASQADIRIRDVRRQYAPTATTIAACFLSALPVVMTEPLVPDFGFLMLISWRLLRPEIWTPVAALPLSSSW